MFLVGTEPHVFPFSRGQELVGDHIQWIIEISPSSLALPHNPRRLPRGLLDTCFFQPPFSPRSQSLCRKELKNTAIAALLSVALCNWMFQTCEFRSQKWQFPQEDRWPSRVSEFTPFHGKKHFAYENCYMSLIPNPPYTWPIEPIISHHWLIWGFLKWSIPSPHPWVSIRSHGPMTRMIRVAPAKMRDDPLHILPEPVPRHFVVHVLGSFPQCVWSLKSEHGYLSDIYIYTDHIPVIFTAKSRKNGWEKQLNLLANHHFHSFSLP